MLPYQQTGGCEKSPETSCGGANLAIDPRSAPSHLQDTKNKRSMNEREKALASAAKRLEQLGIQFERILKRSRSVPEAHGDMANKRPKPLSLSRDSLSDPTRASAFSPGSSFSHDDRWKAMDLHLLASVATSAEVSPASTRFSPHIINQTPNVVVAHPIKGFVLEWLAIRVNTVLEAIQCTCIE